MPRIARKLGGDTDVSRDHTYTDWVDLNSFVAELLAAVAAK